MMALGIESRNEAGHLVISSDVAAFHYAGEAALSESSNLNVSKFPNYPYYFNQKTISGAWRHTFTIVMPPGTTDILVFLRPGNNYGTAYGVLQKYPAQTLPLGLTLWIIIVVQRGHTSIPPDNVLCFRQLAGVTEAKGTYGMATWLDTGEVAFDAQRDPLFLNDNLSGFPPELPFDDPFYPCAVPCEDAYGNVNHLDRDFRSTTREYTFTGSSTPGVPVTNAAFTAPSIAQSVWNHAKLGWKYIDYFFYREFREKFSNWWVFYVQVWYLPETTGRNYITSCWSPYRAGHFYDSKISRTLGYGSLVIASGTDLDTSGNQPYHAETINRFTNNVMLIDATNYI